MGFEGLIGMVAKKEGHDVEVRENFNNN